MIATELRTNIESIAIAAVATVRGERAALRSEMLDAVAASLADRALELSVRRVAAEAYAAHVLAVKYWRIWCDAVVRSRERKAERRAARRAFGEMLDGVGVGPVGVTRGDDDGADEDMVDALADLELNGTTALGDESFANALETARGIWLPSTFVQALLRAADRTGLRELRVVVVVADLCESIVKWYRCKLGIAADELAAAVERRAGSARITIVDAQLDVDDAPTLIVFDCRLGHADLAERFEAVLAAARDAKYLPSVLVVAWPRADASWDETVAEVRDALCDRADRSGRDDARSAAVEPLRPAVDPRRRYGQRQRRVRGRVRPARRRARAQSDDQGDGAGPRLPWSARRRVASTLASQLRLVR